MLSASREAGAAQSLSFLMDRLNPKLEKKGSRWVVYSAWRQGYKTGPGQGTPGQAGSSELLKASKAGVGMTTHSSFLPSATRSWVLGSAAMDKVYEAVPWMNSTGVGGGQGRAQRGEGVDTQKPGPEEHLQGRCLQISARYWFDNGMRIASIVF